MRSFYTIFVLGFALLTVQVDATSLVGRCEIEMSTRARVLVRLIELGIENDALEFDDAQKFVGSSGWYNPYLERSSNEKTVSFRKAFEEASRALTRKDINQVRASLALSLEELNRQSTQLSRAREVTAPIIAPKILRKVSLGGHSTLDNRYGMGVLDGRPIFIGRLIRPGIHARSVLLDPFHPSPDKQVIPIADSEANGKINSLPEFFQLDGVPRAMIFGENLHVNLTTLKNESATRFQKFKEQEAVKIARTALAMGEGYAKVIATAQLGSETGKLLEYDLLNPGLPRVLINDVKASSHHPRVDLIDGQPFVSYYGRSSLYVYDVIKNKILRPIKAHLAGRDENYSLVFADRGRRYAAYFDYLPKPEIFKIRIVDLDTREVKTVGTHLDWPSALEIAYIDGVPHLYFMDESHIFTVNSRTKRTTKVAIEENGTSAQFEFSSDPYVTWVTQEGELNIFSLRDQRMIFSRKILPRRVHQIIPFAYEGEMYALIAISEDTAEPLLIQLTQSPPVVP